jgi:lincosamide nucleotidyltransferase A/C/D/E
MGAASGQREPDQATFQDVALALGLILSEEWDHPLVGRQPQSVPCCCKRHPKSASQAARKRVRHPLDSLVMSRSMSDTLVRMGIAEVLAILVSLEEAGCSVWVAGGWGVDALVGHQTRPHRDLDLAVDANDESSAVAVLRRGGYEIETDWRPVRVELVAPGRGLVDLHPVMFGSDGHGRQADIGGGHFDYPPDGFAEGMIAGRRVRCISLEQQRRFHEGYEPRDIDLHDLALLRRLSSCSIPTVRRLSAAKLR